ncbi:MAG: hypothetical protein ACYDH4_07575 [Candidatus Cryosericum sp.]
MRKRARSVVAGLLVLCCVVAGSVCLAARVQADSWGPAGRSVIVVGNADPPDVAYPLAVSARTVVPVESASSGSWQTAWVWIQKATRSTGAFMASLGITIRNFFVSGQALKVLQTATQSITDFAVRLFLPLSALVVPILERTVPGLSVTPELVAVWMFWIIVVLVLFIVVLALRPRHNMRRRVPRVTPRTPGQEQNTIEFGLVEQGPKPSPTTSTVQPAQTGEKPEESPAHEPSAQPPIPGELSGARLDSSSIPEISLEPLGFFGEADTVPTAVPDGLGTPAAATAPDLPPMVEFVPSEEEPPATPAELPESMSPTAEPSSPVPADVPSEALLTPQQESSAAEESPAETPTPLLSEPQLSPLRQETPTQPIEPESAVSATVLPLDQPMPAEASSVAPGAFQGEEVSVPEVPAVPQTGAVEEPVSRDEVHTPGQEEPVATNSPEKNPATRSGADLLSRLLDNEESFQQTTVAAGAMADAAAHVLPATPISPGEVAPQPVVFSGDIEFDTLLHNGVVTDAGALTQLFRGGYRNRISKLAVSAKDLQNVPQEMRQVIKLTVVALSPIELSIARDLAMRLEAPGYVGEALLVAKKLGYETYLTTYADISKNYKDVSIVDTTSLKVPDTSAESGEDFASFN